MNHAPKPKAGTRSSMVVCEPPRGAQSKTALATQCAVSMMEVQTSIEISSPYRKCSRGTCFLGRQDLSRHLRNHFGVVHGRTACEYPQEEAGTEERKRCEETKKKSSCCPKSWKGRLKFPRKQARSKEYQ